MIRVAIESVILLMLTAICAQSCDRSNAPGWMTLAVCFSPLLSFYMGGFAFVGLAKFSNQERVKS